MCVLSILYRVSNDTRVLTHSLTKRTDQFDKRIKYNEIMTRVVFIILDVAVAVLFFVVALGTFFFYRYTRICVHLSLVRMCVYTRYKLTCQYRHTEI